MIMIPKLITDKKQSGLPNPEFTKLLEKPVERTSFTKESSDELYKILSDSIEKYGGVGISANQLGINQRACLIKIDDFELFLLNPFIKKRSDESFVFYEGCLSIPKTMSNPIRTVRPTWVEISSDNFGDLRFEINPSEDNESVSLDTMKTVVVQHEIDHLDGITIKKRVYTTQFTNKMNYGRNDKVYMKSPSGDIVEVKYKKANNYYLNGYELI